MLNLTKNQKKKLGGIKEAMFKELTLSKPKESKNKLDSGQGNPIISKYKKQIIKIINDKK